VSKKFSDTFCRTIVFEEIERVVWPPSWLGHAPFALWLMESLKPKTLVELGTHSGNSFAAFCQGAKFLDYSPSCYAVDTWEGDPHAGVYGEEIFADVSQYFSKSYGNISHLLRMTFNDALKNFADGSIDLLNIDGYHTYEATKENFDTWLSKMSSKGVVLIHDTNVRTADFGAWKFWDEIKDKYPSFNFLHSHGLGVAVVGSEIPEPIKVLTESTSEQTSQILKLFSALGSGPVLKAENDRLNSQVAELEQSSARDHVEFEKERAASAPWIAFVQQHLGSNLDEAGKRLNSISQGNLEGISYKLFVQRVLGTSVEAADKKLEQERAESLSWKNFVQGNIANDLELARKKLEDLGKSNLEGIGYRLLVQRHLGQSVDEAAKKIEENRLESQQLAAWKNIVNPQLGETLGEAEQKLDQLLECSEAMKSPAHKTASFVNKRIMRKGSNARKL